MRPAHILILLTALLGTTWLTTLVDDGLGLDWTANVTRNWEQYGFSNLHGKLVVNPGGYEAVTHPQYYAGHRPASLYPLYFIHHLTGGLNLDFLPFYLIVAAVVSLSIWQMLGRGPIAFWFAVTLILSPGYIRWQTTQDPNLAAVMWGYPFSVVAFVLLQKSRLKPAEWLLLGAATALYSAINWSAAFVHAMLFMALLLHPRVSRRNLLAYASVAATVGLLVLSASVASKMTNAAGQHAPPSSLFQSYCWGNQGYGADLTTKTAIMRLTAVNLMGLLPVLMLLGWLVWRKNAFRRSKIGLLFLVPLVVPLLEMTALRNYFGHHPWMSCNFVLLGLVLAIVTWQANQTGQPEKTVQPVKLPWQIAALAGLLLYGSAVLEFYHIHNAAEINLAKFLRAQTSRATTIAINPDTDPELATMIELRLPELFDRNVIPANIKTNAPAPIVLLTAVASPPAGHLIARSQATGGSPLMEKMLAWYSRTIAHRRAGDKLDFADNYYLYEYPAR